MTIRAAAMKEHCISLLFQVCAAHVYKKKFSWDVLVTK